MTQIWIGLDGGGTKTHVIAENQDHIRFEAMYSGSNHHVIGLERFRNLMETIIKEVEGFYKTTPSELTIVVGGAGIDTEEDVKKLKAITRSLKADFHFVNDADVALISNHEALKGGVLISGTGSIALGYEKGKRFRVGGWGHVVGDEGSGYAIGRDALAACTRMLDGRLEQSDVLQSILDFLKRQPYQLSDYVNDPHTTKEMIAALVPVVLRHRTEPDIKCIIQKSIEDLYEHLRVIDQRLDEGESIALVGGLMLQTSLGTEVIQYAKAKGIKRPLFISDVSPVEGALQMAKKGGFI